MEHGSPWNNFLWSRMEYFSWLSLEPSPGLRRICTEWCDWKKPGNWWSYQTKLEPPLFSTRERWWLPCMVLGDHRGGVGQVVYHVQKGRSRIRGKKKTVCVWKIMSISVRLEDIICGGKLDCMAGEKVQNWVLPGCVWHNQELEISFLGRVRTEHLLLAEMGSFHREIQEKHFLGSMHGRMRFSGRIYWGWSKQLCPGSGYLFSLLSHCGTSTTLLSSGPQQRPVPRNSGPCCSLVQFSLWPHLACLVCSRLCFGWHCIAVSTSCLEPALVVHVAVSHRTTRFSQLLWGENMWMNPCECLLLGERARGLLNWGYIISGLGKTSIFFSK